MEKKEFTTEVIKRKPVNKDKIIHKSIITLVLAVVFGLVSCFTFTALKPVISNILYPAETNENMVMLPEDREEMMPEEMLSENLLEFDSNSTVSIEEKKFEKMLKSMTLDFTDYQNLYQSMSDYMYYLQRYMVEVVSIQSDVDWLYNMNEEKYKTSGILIGKNEENYYILTDYQSIKNSDRQEVTFFDGNIANANLVNMHEESNLALLRVSRKDVSEESESGYSVVSFGASTSQRLIGTVAVAMGSPLGIYGSVGYGIITSTEAKKNVTDIEYHVLNTQILGSNKATGALFDLNGRLVGVILPGLSNYDISSSISAYGVSDLKRVVNFMLEGEEFPCFGIKGKTISDETNKRYGIPKGIFVEEVEMNSPAMLSGIQKGDVIIKLDDKEIMEMSYFTSNILKRKEGEEVEVTIMRQSFGSYKEMIVKLVIQNLKK